MKKLLMTALGGLVLVACTTPAQKAAQMQNQMNEMMVVYGPACSRLGYAANSDQWRHCVLDLSAKEDAQRWGYPAYSVGYGRGRWGLGGHWGPW